MIRSDKCPKCDQKDLLIYGGFNHPISCGVCESKKNPDKWQEIQRKEMDEFLEAIKKLKTLMELQYGKSNRVSKKSE